LPLYGFYGNNFKIECPTSSGKLMNPFEVVREIANRLTRIFLRDPSGRRPAHSAATRPSIRSQETKASEVPAELFEMFAKQQQTDWFSCLGLMEA
jgi:hypothetical protein